MIDPAVLHVALANEINVSELAALWMPTTPELDVKLAFARQAGDEASHFRLVADRLTALGFDVGGFAQPAPNALFQYLRTLGTTVERIAAGLVALESIAYEVNEQFIAYAAQAGDAETVRIYREYIQPDERAHHELGTQLLAKHARTAELRQLGERTIARVRELASSTRAMMAEKLGASCFPGC
jgi:uncharacterized ferritin-like protein (DUF455 family)